MSSLKKTIVYGILSTLGLITVGTASAYYDEHYHVYRVYILDDGTRVY